MFTAVIHRDECTKAGKKKYRNKGRKKGRKKHMIEGLKYST
jgi:hypothetical protein